MLSLVLIASPLAMPLRDCDESPCYPTAYFAHQGRDWACRDRTYGDHPGTDFGIGGFDEMDQGRLVHAAAAGRVIQIEDGHFDRCRSGDCEGGGGYGNHVILDHGDGYQSIYGHLRDGSITVAMNEEVDCGSALGFVGSSGYSTGAHLHFEWRVDDEAIDPFMGPCGAEESAWVVQGLHGELPGRLCANQLPPEGEDSCRVLEEPGPPALQARLGSRMQFCWLLENSGSRAWNPATVSARHSSGERHGILGNLELSASVDPGDEIELCASVLVTGEPGEISRSSWRMARAGSVFGATLMMRIHVLEASDAGPARTDSGPTSDPLDAGSRPNDGGQEQVVAGEGCSCTHGSSPSALWVLGLLLLCLRRLSYRAPTLN